MPTALGDLVARISSPLTHTAARADRRPRPALQGCVAEAFSLTRNNRQASTGSSDSTTTRCRGNTAVKPLVGPAQARGRATRACLDPVAGTNRGHRDPLAGTADGYRRYGDRRRRNTGWSSRRSTSASAKPRLPSERTPARTAILDKLSAGLRATSLPTWGPLVRAVLPRATDRREGVRHARFVSGKELAEQPAPLHINNRPGDGGAAGDRDPRQTLLITGLSIVPRVDRVVTNGTRKKAGGTR